MQVKFLSEDFNAIFSYMIPFLENFSPKNQNKVQTAHFKNQPQISLLGAAIHYNPDGEEIKKQSLLILSDDTTHNSSAVFASYTELQKWLGEKMPNLKKTTIVSDGCGGQFKNKYEMTVIAYHDEYFGCEGEWAFR